FPAAAHGALSGLLSRSPGKRQRHRGAFPAAARGALSGLPSRRQRYPVAPVGDSATGGPSRRRRAAPCPGYSPADSDTP
ncbi:TPA: hypothetical protein I8235_000766, partial [Kluyvera intermedia]|nr:hypothetical protein [Kluyvera intermedia]